MKPYFTKTYTGIKQSATAKAGDEVFYNADHQILVNLLQENQEQDSLFDAKPSSELFNLLRFSSSMLTAFPVGLVLRKHIRKNKKLNYILQFKELLQVRNNIEKGSFAYDTLLFKQSPLQLLKNKSHLANLVCLAILFGDEFIDGIAAAHGKKNIQYILSNEQLDYYLRYKNDDKGYQLYYQFDICDVLPQSVLEATNEKYGITYKAFYHHLQ